MQYVVQVLLLVMGVVLCRGQNIIPNSSMEVGTNAPASWGLTGSGSWASLGRTGGRSGALNPTMGAGYWYSAAPIEGNRAYVVRMWARSTNASYGYCSGGFTTIWRDFSKPTDYWQEFSMAAWLPTNGSPFFNFGILNTDGTSYLDDAEVLPLNAVHKRVGPYQLGDGESLAAGHYTFRPQFEGYGANFARPLLTANAFFSLWRWVMRTNTSVIYHHNLDGVTFSNAQVECAIQSSGLTGPVLKVEASTNGINWLLAGTISANATNPAVILPASLGPLTSVYVRLSTTNLTWEDFWLTSYTFSGDVSDTDTSGTGETHYFGDFMINSTVRIAAAETTPSGHLITLAIPNLTSSNQIFQIVANTTYSTNSRTRTVDVFVPSGTTNQAGIVLPTAGLGNNTCMLTVKDAAGVNLFQQNITLNVGILSDDSYGEALPSPGYAPTWWCDGGYKVGRSRVLPMVTNASVRIAAAHNEYEPFQLMLRPTLSLSNVSATISDFISVSNRGIISATNVTICRVEYVNVTQLKPGERYSTTGEHPDPLVPLTGTFDAPADTNTALWFTVHVPKRVPPGVYQASVTISSFAGTFAVPVQLRVFGFALTDVTHTPTAYGAVLPIVWHGLQNASPVEVQTVWELYLANLARHRISTYFPQWCSPVAWNMNRESLTFNPTYTNFDIAMERYLEEYNFTCFKDVNFYRELPLIPGLSPIIGTNINPEYRPVYPRLMQPFMQHLREKGWADRAYSFWIDEPQPPQYPLVQDGMRLVEETAPDLKRYIALFNPLAPELIGYIDRWSILMPGLNTNTIAARQAAGEEVWSYVATTPHAPWPNNFIDHPAINPRARAWLALRMGVTGEEYYGINYYLGTTNVWTNPMSSIDQTRSNNYNWGNGDGTLVYPPVKEYPSQPVIAGPFDSVRWEMIREAQEDREYFWSLDRVLAAREPILGADHPAIVEARAARAAALNLVAFAPADIYPYDPGKFYEARLRLGAAIEALDNGAPFVAKQPLSKTARTGSAETLRIEACGWPLPTIQWLHAGTNLPGQNTDKLILSDLNSELAGDYAAILANPSGVVTSVVGRITVYDANSLPVVVAQSTGMIRTNGARAVFWVGASSVTPLTYQWLFEGVPIFGQTNMTLILTNLVSTNVGYYSALIKNAVGTTQSTPASLYVVTPGSNALPVITMQPASQIRFRGQPAQFVASVVGLSPIGYQWYFNTNTPLEGETASTLSLASVDLHQFGTYMLRATNFAGAVTSTPAILQVATMPQYTNQQPVWDIGEGGTSVNLTLAPDNRIRTILTSTNLSDWTFFYSAAPSVMPIRIPVVATNEPQRFFRLQADLQSPAMPVYSNQEPVISGAWLGADYILTLEPDNRSRSILTSTNLRDWSLFYTPSPSALPEAVPTISEGAPRRFFRLLANP